MKILNLLKRVKVKKTKAKKSIKIKGNTFESTKIFGLVIHPGPVCHAQRNISDTNANHLQKCHQNQFSSIVEITAGKLISAQFCLAKPILQVKVFVLMLAGNLFIFIYLICSSATYTNQVAN